MSVDANNTNIILANFLRFLNFHVCRETWKLISGLLSNTPFKKLSDCESISPICNPLAVSQVKGELSKSNFPSIALKSENHLMISCSKATKWELQFLDNSFVTTCLFNTGKWTKFCSLSCFPKNWSFNWKASASLYNSWAKTPFSLLLSSFSFFIISTANAKPHTQIALRCTWKRHNQYHTYSKAWQFLLCGPPLSLVIFTYLTIGHLCGKGRQ